MFSGFQDRLLLMPRALAKDAVQAKPDEQGDEREDDDDGQFKRILSVLPSNIVRRA
jgi:hypothetical protein